MIVVEDIIDSGLTLNYLLRYLRARAAGVPRGVLAVLQGGPPARADPREVRGLPDRPGVRRRLRPRLPGAVPEPGVPGRPERAPGDQGRPQAASPRVADAEAPGSRSRVTLIVHAASHHQARNPLRRRLGRNALIYAIIALGAIWLVGSRRRPRRPSPSGSASTSSSTRSTHGDVATADMFLRDQRIEGELDERDEVPDHLRRRRRRARRRSS